MTSSAASEAGQGPASLHLPHSAKQSHSEEAPEPDLEASSGGCPNNPHGFVYLHKFTGEIAPWRCGRNACEYCVQGNARRRARAIALAAPERALLLTQVGDSWNEIRPRVANLRYWLTKELGKSFEWVYHVEQNPEETGHHVHAWQRGCYIPQDVLSKTADRVGMGGVAFINRVRSPLESANYGLKGLGYGLKGVEAAESRGTYLRVNGRRLTHQSRGFFVDSEGGKLGVRDAERLACASGEEPGQWQLTVMPSAQQNG